MENIGFRQIGYGVYTISEAERLTRVPRQSIRRWTKGYTYKYKSEIRFTPPIIAIENSLEKEMPVLNFADLIEIMFLNCFRNGGVGWKTIHIASQKAREMLQRTRPFSTRLFKTDGRSILTGVGNDVHDKVLLDIVKDQYVFENIIAPYLHGLEYNHFAEPERWWPLGTDRCVVIDPQRSFGAPIVAGGGIPTLILHKAVKAEQSINLVADWYDVRLQEVMDAFEFEEGLAA
jgi:uncharacterized protein (DUF433 family)